MKGESKVLVKKNFTPLIKKNKQEELEDEKEES